MQACSALVCFLSAIGSGWFLSAFQSCPFASFVSALWFGTYTLSIAVPAWWTTLLLLEGPRLVVFFALKSTLPGLLLLLFPLISRCVICIFHLFTSNLPVPLCLKFLLKVYLFIRVRTGEVEGERERIPTTPHPHVGCHK